MKSRQFFLKAVGIIILQRLAETSALDKEGAMCDGKESSGDLPFCLPRDYRNDVGPFTTKPLNVTIIAVFKDIAEVNDADNTVTFSIELYIEWVDSRLKLDLNSPGWNDDYINWVSLNPKWLGYLWKPNIDIVNAVGFKTKYIFEDQSYLELYQDHTFLYRVAVDITLKCPLFKFETYPFDEQVCDLFIGSYFDDVTRAVFNGHVPYNKSNQRPLQYDVKLLSLLPFKDGLLSYHEYCHTGNGNFVFKDYVYSTFAVRMVFARLLQPHVLCTYLPSFLLVVSSWLGFLIRPESPGRIALSVTLLLVLMNMR